MEGIRIFFKARNNQMQMTEHNRLKFEAQLRLIETTGDGTGEIMLQPSQEPVTEDQHAYYRAFVRHTLVGCEMFGGWDERRIHKFFQGRFLSYTKVELINGKEYVVPHSESTANIGKKRMAEFITQVIAWCAQEGITIGSPDDYFAGKYKTIKR